MSAAACIVAIPNQPADTGDAGVNAYPVIQDVTPAMPGPFDFNPRSPIPVSFTLSDSDIGDTLYLRIFFDYNTTTHTIPLFSKKVTNDANGQETRPQLASDSSSFCRDATDTMQHRFDAVVSDREWDDTATERPGQTPLKGGKTSTRSWVGRCLSAP